MCAEGNQYNHFPAQWAEWKKHYTCQAFPWCVCVREGYTLTHSYTLTTMPTCLSIRFYHHRDTVDSSFVRPEKTGALRSQTTTFTVICKGCGYASVCVHLCSSGTQRKRSRMWTIGETKSLCLFRHVRICAFVSPCICPYVLMFLALRELLNTLRSVGVVFQRKKEVKY